MSSLIDKIYAVDGLNLDYVVYNFYTNLYGWEKLTLEEFKNKKNDFPDLKKISHLTQWLYLDTLEICYNIFSGRYNYDIFLLENNSIKEYSRVCIKESQVVDCNCRMTLDEKVKAKFVNTPIAKIFNTDLVHIANAFYNPATKKSYKKDIATGKIYDEQLRIEGVKELPEPYCSNLPSELADLIVEEVIQMHKVGYINDRPILVYSLKNK